MWLIVSSGKNLVVTLKWKWITTLFASFCSWILFWLEDKAQLMIHIKDQLRWTQTAVDSKEWLVENNKMEKSEKNFIQDMMSGLDSTICTGELMLSYIQIVCMYLCISKYLKILQNFLMLKGLLCVQETWWYRQTLLLHQEECHPCSSVRGSCSLQFFNNDVELNNRILIIFVMSYLYK